MEINDTTFAPIALFVYKRPEHTQQMVEHLMRCPEFDQSPVYVFSDWAKQESDEESVRETRGVVDRLLGQRAHIIKREKNWGLAASITDGVTTLCEQYGAVIVVEDDLLVASTFLTYMNLALKTFEAQPKVVQISGHMFPVQFSKLKEAAFLPFPTSWGWATWQKEWRYFIENQESDVSWATENLMNNSSERKRFDLDGNYPYFRLLSKQLEGEVDSWAILWYLSQYRQGGLTLYPNRTLVSNQGFDGSGTHSSQSAGSEQELRDGEAILMPEQISVNKFAYQEVQKYLGWQNKLAVKIAKRLFGFFSS